MQPLIRTLILAGVTAAHLLPLAVSLILSWDTRQLSFKTRGWVSLVVTGTCTTIHLLAYMVLHKLLRDRWNFLYTAKAILALDFTYQDIDYFPVSLGLRLAGGIVLGLVLRFLLSLLNKGRWRCPSLTQGRLAALYGVAVVAGVTVIGTLYYGLTGTQNILINEVGNYNVTMVLDETGQICDYVELYNRGSLDCIAYQLYLSDDMGNLQMKEIPYTRIPAKGHLLVKLDGDVLKLKKEGGETLILSDGYGRLLDQVETSAADPDYSCSRKEDASASWVMLSGTPGYSNSESVRKAAMPVLSHQSGMYDQAFDLDISAKAGSTIHYTLDGSTPTTQSPVYTQPIRVYDRSAEPNVWSSQQRVVADWQTYQPDPTPVDKAFVVRAVAVDADGAVSDPVTATYFVGLPQYSQDTVISLVADPEDMWGENGIYVTGAEYDAWYLGDRSGTAPGVNYAQRGIAWEAKAHMDYLSDQTSWSQEIGLRITGGSSRGRAKKSFSLYARERYSGSSLFDHMVIDQIPSHKLAIRGGYANAICQSLTSDRGFGTQRLVRVAVFLNGEFWYYANLMEKYDSQYLSAHYGVNPDNTVIIKAGGLEEGRPGDEKLYHNIYDYLKTHDMSLEDDYAGFGEILDLQSYIDYMCFNIYIDNMDFTETKNSVWWRSREVTGKPYEDGKWRFMLYDLDAMEWGDSTLWGVETQAQKNSFSLIPRYTGEQPIHRQPIYVALKQNPEFRRQFVLTFQDLANTIFRYEHVKQVLDSYGRNTTDYLSGNGGTRDTDYYDTFFQTRAVYILPHMAEEFSLTGTLETLTLRVNNPEAGTIQLNTITPDMAQGSWSGQYYTDYPVTLTAVAKEGYTFVGWEGSTASDNTTIQTTLTKGGATLRAVFEKTETP